MTYDQEGDFLIDQRWHVEVGGKNKKAAQVKHLADNFIVADDIAIGVENQIPLWLFGFLA